MIQKIKGTMDLFPEDTVLFRHIEGIMREEAARYGFGEIRTPTFENTELFVRGVGDTTDVVQKEMYTFADRDENRSISLRPEGPASNAPTLCLSNIITSFPASGMRSPRQAEAASSSSSEQRCSARRILPQMQPR